MMTPKSPHSTLTPKFEYHSGSRKFSINCLKKIDSHVDLPWQSLWFSFSFLESLMLDPNSLNIHVQYKLTIFAVKIAHDSADHKY